MLAILASLSSISAQKESNVRLLAETGLLGLSDADNLGLFLNLEPKLKVFENAFIGLRIGVVINAQKFEHYDISQFNIDTAADNGGMAFALTFDYYLNENDLRPYLGVGAGPYLLANYVDVSRVIPSPPSEDTFEVKVNNQLGFLIRGGVESRNLRFGIEYNLISKADLKSPNEEPIGIVNNSYLGLSIGFVIGAKRNLK